jgi:uncharacterized membrane protein YphA (DoxX/SURF4 family)
MTRPAAFFLVFLRLAIGWHFLVEGFQKLPSEQLTALGLPTNNKPFSSSVYFREATGPLGDAIRRTAGDPDDEALARLEVQPIPPGQDPATYKPQLRVPPGLKKDWRAYLERFKSFYGLDAGQQERADVLLEQAEARVVGFLTYVPDADTAKREKDPHYEGYTSEQTRAYPSGEVKRRMTMGERIADYKAKLAELRDTTGHKLWLFGRDVEGARLRSAKAEVASLRAGLLSDLDKQTQAYKESLDKLLTPQQKTLGAPAAAKDRGIVDVIDLITPWALTGIGACLLVGLFTRLAAFLGGMFLLMTYLAVPALPWLPAAPISEGSYLFVNKNVIEMLALFALVCLPTGRWFGADGLLYALTGPFRRRTTTPVASGWR